MKPILLLLLFLGVNAITLLAQTKVIDKVDAQKQGIDQVKLFKTYPPVHKLFEKRPQEAQDIFTQSVKPFLSFQRKHNFGRFKVGFSLFEYYEPSGEVSLVVVEWRDNAADSVKQQLMPLLEEYYRTKPRLVVANIRFSMIQGFNGMTTFRRTAGFSPNVIGTVEAAQKTTRPDTVKVLAFLQLDLDTIPDVVYRFPNLTELDLSRNNIVHLPARLTADLPKLEKLSLLYNSLKDDSVFFTRNKHLKALNLQGNSLTNLPASVRQNRRLESLWMGNNKLKTIDFRGLRRLTDLNLYNAGIENISPSASKMKRLKVLDLYYNYLTELPARLGRLRRLEQLAISHNKLKQLPERLSKLKKLQILYAHHNEIGTLPDRFDRLRRLRLLDLGYNFFSTTPPVLDRIGSLEDIDLSGNNLQELSPGLSNLPNLKKLYLRNNPITDDKGRMGSFSQTIRQLEARKTEVFH